MVAKPLAEWNKGLLFEWRRIANRLEKNLKLAQNAWWETLGLPLSRRVAVTLFCSLPVEPAGYLGVVPRENRRRLAQRGPADRK